MLAEKKLLCVVLTMMFCFMNIATALASFERGDEGQEVIDIQKRLVELQYKVSNVDGKFGPETEAAVKQFQTDKSLEVDGIIGNDTYRALMQKDMPPNRSGRSAAVRNVIRAAYSVLGTPYVLAVPVLMALIVQVLLNMLLHVQESAFPVWLTASYIMAVRFP